MRGDVESRTGPTPQAGSAPSLGRGCRTDRPSALGRQPDRPFFLVRSIDCLDQRDDSLPILTGLLGRAILEDRLEEVLNLQCVVLVDRVGQSEPGSILGLEPLQQMLFAGYGPEIIEWRLGDRAHTRDECRAAVGLDADRASFGTVDVDLGVNSRLL